MFLYQALAPNGLFLAGLGCCWVSRVSCPAKPWYRVLPCLSEWLA